MYPQQTPAETIVVTPNMYARYDQWMQRYDAACARPVASSDVEAAEHRDEYARLLGAAAALISDLRAAVRIYRPQQQEQPYPDRDGLEGRMHPEPLPAGVLRYDAFDRGDGDGEHREQLLP